MVTNFNAKDMLRFAVYNLSLVEKGMKLKNEDGSYDVSYDDLENWKVGDPPLLVIENPSRGIKINLYSEQDVRNFEDARQKRIDFECSGMRIFPWDEDWFWKRTESCRHIHVGELIKPSKKSVK